MSRQLETLLELRQSEERNAEDDVRQRVDARLQAERALEELRRRSSLARERARAAGRIDDVLHYDRPPDRLAGSAVLLRAQFAERMRREADRLVAATRSHEEGALAAARTEEAAARDRHRDARRAREAIEKRIANNREVARRTGERREEDRLDDLSTAAFGRRR